VPLAPLSRDTDTILINGYGNHFSEKSLTGMMAHWTKQADIEPGYTLHGLRKSYGVDVAESGASERQQKDMLGHTTMQQVVEYSREANKLKMTVEGTRRLEAYHDSRAQAAAPPASPPPLRIVSK
jgi:site-specific recombinase XerD